MVEAIANRESEPLLVSHRMSNIPAISICASASIWNAPSFAKVKIYNLQSIGKPNFTNNPAET